MSNTLAYYDLTKIAAIKSFIVQAPGGKGYQNQDHLCQESQTSKLRKKFMLLQLSGGFVGPGNTKGGSITVPLTSCLTGLESAV